MASGLTVTVNSNTIICLHKSKSICCICLALFTVSGLLQKAVKLQPLKKVGLRKLPESESFPLQGASLSSKSNGQVELEKNIQTAIICSHLL